MSQQHSIKKQVLDIVLDSSRRAPAIRDNAERVFKDEIIPLMDRVFSSLTSADETLRIDKLEIDLGEITLDSFRYEFKEALLKKLPSEVSKQVMAGKAELLSTPAGEKRGQGAGKTDKTDFELLAHFIRTGTYPWWIKKGEVYSIPELIRSQLTANPEGIKQLLVSIEGKPSAIRRFTGYLDPLLQPELFALFIPHHKEKLDDAVSVLSGIIEKQAASKSSREVKKNILFTFLKALIKGPGQFSLAAAAGEAIKTGVNEKNEQILTDFKEQLQQKGWSWEEKPKKTGTKKNALAVIRSELEILAELLDGGRNREDLSVRLKLVIDQTARSLTGLISALDKAEQEPKSSEALQNKLEKERKNFESRLAALYEECKKLLLKQAKSDETDTEVKQSRTKEKEYLSKMIKEKGSLNKVIKEKDSPNKMVKEKDSLNKVIKEKDSPNKMVKEKDSPIKMVKERDYLKKLIESIDSLKKSKDPVNEERIHSSFAESEELYVSNCGLVLLWPYLARFFRTLELLEKDTFTGDEARSRAVLLLHYLCTGTEEAGEQDLVLNKILCGLEPDDYIDPGFSIDETWQHECNALLESMIANWGVLKNTSVNGLRSMFLIRPGLIRYRDGRPVLQVEEQAYDILLDKMPWGFGTVKLPWMKELLFVEWRL